MLTKAKRPYAGQNMPYLKRSHYSFSQKQFVYLHQNYFYQLKMYRL